MRFRVPASRLYDERGVAVVEAAIVLPVLLALLFAILCFADWFFVAHGIQQAANDGARAAIGGLDAAERSALADAAARASIARGGSLDPARATTAIDDDGTTIALRIGYDAANRPLLSAGPARVVPLTVNRAASVRIDGL